MNVRMRAAVSLAAAAGLLAAGGATTASAATPASAPTALRPVAFTGVTATGERYRATYSVERLVRSSSGKSYAFTQVRGQVGRRVVTRRVVRVAVDPTARAAQITPTPGACQVLNLVLGPLDLNLLGLRARLSQVDLLIEAIPGGGLLGDLLCGLSGGPRSSATAARRSNTFTVQRFTTRAGRLYAIAGVRGRVAGRSVSRSVAIPTAQAAQITPTPGACQVLNLTLGPLDLTLLGVRVRTSRIDLRLEAIPGGGLLGDLLCGLSGGPTATVSSTRLAQTLNQLLGLGTATRR